MKGIAVSSVKNKDILHDIALTLGVMNMMHMAISSWDCFTQNTSFRNSSDTSKITQKSQCKIRFEASP